MNGVQSIDFEIFLAIAFYQPGIYLVEELQQYIPDVFYQMCIHVDDNYPNNLAEYTDTNRNKILIKQIHIPAMPERLEAIFYKTQVKFGTLQVLKINKELLDKWPVDKPLPVERLLSKVKEVLNRTDVSRYDIGILLDMYKYKKGVNFKRQ